MNVVAALDCYGSTVAMTTTDSTRAAYRLFEHVRRAVRRGRVASSLMPFRPADYALIADVAWFHRGRLIATLK